MRTWTTPDIYTIPKSGRSITARIHIFLTLTAVWSLCGTKTTTLCKSFPTPDGEKVQYQYTDGNLTSITARDGSITKLDYTADRLTAVSMYDGAHSWYEYKVEYTYDSAGRIQRVQE